MKPPRTATTTDVVASPPDQVWSRVMAYLQAQGFDIASADRAAGLISTEERLSGPEASDQANCVGAFERPRLYMAQLSVSIAPAGGETRLGITSRFSAVRENGLHQSLDKADCKSRGVVERGLRTAAAG